MAFHSVPGWLQRLAPGYCWQLPPTPDHAAKPIYLTFDDGPVPGPTEFVLDVLASYRAKATFFAVGDNVRRYPTLARRVVAEGHVLANHTQHHKKGWQMTTEAYLQEVERCRQTLQAETGQAPALFRPPYGRITPAQGRALRAQGYQVVMWSVLSADYDAGLSPGRCLVETYRRCQAGSVVVFHDSLKAAPRMEKVLPALLEVLQGEGYTIAALPAPTL